MNRFWNLVSNFFCSIHSNEHEREKDKDSKEVTKNNNKFSYQNTNQSQNINKSIKSSSDNAYLRRIKEYNNCNNESTNDDKQYYNNPLRTSEETYKNNNYQAQDEGVHINQQSQQLQPNQTINIDLLEKQLVELEKTKKEVNRYLETIKAEKLNIDYKNNSNYEINRLIQENQTVKSDNIIFKEDINRLSELNKRLEDDLIRQRHRNLEIANDLEIIYQENLLLKDENNKLHDALNKFKSKEDTQNEETRSYLAFKPNIAPVICAVSPLLKNKPELVDSARVVYGTLKAEFGRVMWDDNGNIGKRYRRQDEIGTPWCIVVDFDTIGSENPENKDTVTIRDRDTGTQERVKISELVDYIKEKLQ